MFFCFDNLPQARLAEMVEARKKEEELLQRKAERAMTKRKKFKEVREY